jgi:hypothetical protein
MLMFGKCLKGPFHNVTGGPGAAMRLIGAFFLKQVDDRMDRTGLRVPWLSPPKLKHTFPPTVTSIPFLAKF